ncbi:LuxR C-terminal-related transcriptional regulator [Roseivirga sp. BDSF3-8]|uniref:LuxR C-terminal-related transcriptional regulator n=1 Tax=Roseivirga sp. BDSF3-8 TaxID=3241598 RepID=UPI003531EA9E
MKQASGELHLKDLLHSGSFFNHFLSFFDHIPCASYFLIDLSVGRMVHASRPLLQITGHSLDNLKEEGSEFFLSQIHPEDKPIVMQTFKEQIQDFRDFQQKVEPSIRKYTLKLQTSRREYGHFEVYTTIFDLDINPATVMVGMVKDVTEVHHKSEYLLSVLSTYLDEREMSTTRQKLTEIKKSSEEIRLREVNEHFHRYKWLKNRLEQLSDREMQVLQLIAEGLSSKELAERLNISSHTATSHRKNLMSKFKVRNTAELIKEASKVFSFN